MSFIRKYKKDGKTYLAEVKSVREDGKVTQKFIRYVGKEVDGETIITTSTKDLEVNEVKLQGPLLALNAIAKKINSVLSVSTDKGISEFLPILGVCASVILPLLIMLIGFKATEGESINNKNKVLFQNSYIFVKSMLY